MGYLKRSNNEIENDLSLVQEVTNKIKVYHNPFMNAGSVAPAASLAIVKNIVLKAKARGMYVIWTENDDSVTLTDALWNNYTR